MKKVSRQQHWAKEETLQLINIYKRYPILYDPNHPDYDDNGQKEDAFANIFDEIKIQKPNVTMQMIHNKIKVLHYQVREEIERVGANNLAKKTYVPKLWCFQQLKFLCPLFETNIDYDDDSKTSLENLGQEKNSTEAINSESSGDTLLGSHYALANVPIGQERNAESISNPNYINEDQSFGNFVADELKLIQNPKKKRKLRHLINDAIKNIALEDEQEAYQEEAINLTKKN